MFNTCTCGHSILVHNGFVGQCATCDCRSFEAASHVPNPEAPGKTDSEPTCESSTCNGNCGQAIHSHYRYTEAEHNAALRRVQPEGAQGEKPIPPMPEYVSKDGAYHCCVHCGWIPIEGMRGYLNIHGMDALCLVCEKPLRVDVAASEKPSIDVAKEAREVLGAAMSFFGMSSNSDTVKDAVRFYQYMTGERSR